MRNRNYKRPSWEEEVKPTLESLDSDPKKINYLREILTRDLQAAEKLPRRWVEDQGHGEAEKKTRM